jgi:hypothetical protein
MVVHACDPSTWELRQEDHEFKVSPGKGSSDTLSQKQKGVKKEHGSSGIVFG